MRECVRYFCQNTTQLQKLTHIHSLHMDGRADIVHLISALGSISLQTRVWVKRNKFGKGTGNNFNVVIIIENHEAGRDIWTSLQMLLLLMMIIVFKNRTRSDTEITTKKSPYVRFPQRWKSFAVPWVAALHSLTGGLPVRFQQDVNFSLS
jgi:hypothetical protein